MLDYYKKQNQNQRLIVDINSEKSICGFEVSRLKMR